MVMSLVSEVAQPPKIFEIGVFKDLRIWVFGTLSSIAEGRYRPDRYKIQPRSVQLTQARIRDSTSGTGFLDPEREGDPTLMTRPGPYPSPGPDGLTLDET